MTEALVVSNVLSWIVILILAGIVAALARQVGLLHERVAPVGALATAHGPSVGDAAPPIDVTELGGGVRTIGGVSGASTLVFFVSPTCPVCKSLLPTVERVIAAERDVELVLASDGPLEEHLPFVEEHALDRFPYVLSTELGHTYQVAKLPYAVLLDAEGILRAKGIVNTREHVESLFAARGEGVGSIQEYLDRRERRAV